MAEHDWIDISIPLGKEIPELFMEASEREVPRSKVERFFDVEKGDRVTMSRIEMEPISIHLYISLKEGPL